MMRDPATDEMPGRVSPGFVKLASIWPLEKAQ
jgi:hypothetical protein